jgi:hypothetical protein
VTGPELVWVTHPDNYHPTVHQRLQRAGATRVELLRQRGLPVRVVHANAVVAAWVDRPRLWCDGTDLLDRRRGFLLSGWAWDPAAVGHLQAIQRTVQGSDSVLLDDGMSGPDGLRSDKLAMYHHAGRLGLPVLPTVAIPFGRYSRGALGLISEHLGPDGYVVKPREMAMGFGVLPAGTAAELAAVLDLTSASGLSCLVQPFRANHGDLRVFVYDGRVIAAMLRRPDPGGHVANLPAGGDGSPETAPPQTRAMSEQLAGSLAAGYLCVDWLLTETGPVFNEWMTVGAGFEALPEPARGTVADALAGYLARRLADGDG